MYGMGSLGSGVDEAVAPAHQAPPMAKDPKLLTKSTINNDGHNQPGYQYVGAHGVQHSASFGPGGGPPAANMSAAGHGPGPNSN